MFSCETYEIFKNTQSEVCERLKPALSLGLPFLISCGFGCQFSLHCYWSCFNQKQSSGGALRKRCSNKFRKFYKKTPDLRLSFHEVVDLQSLTLKKKRFWHRCFIVNSRKFLIKPFLKNPSDGCFCISTLPFIFPARSSTFSKTMSHIFFGWVFSRLNL